MNRHISQPRVVNKEMLKLQEFSKQQQQLKELGYKKKSDQSKVISAESMIEDLLSKKETFQKQNPDSHQSKDAAMPLWLSTTPPPLFEKVWLGAQTAGGLADTPLLSSVLLTSGLSTDTLGYIWSLANRTVPGALTQTEVYLVLALVGLAQAGYIVHDLGALQQVPQAPIPTLDLTLLSSVYPKTLNVTNLPDSFPSTWASADTVPSAHIGVSYVSSGPMVCPNLLSDEANKFTTSVKFSGDSNVREGVAFSNLKSDLGTATKNSTSQKRSDNIHSFSFPKLNESPSHVMNAVNTDPFDDEFSEFQSADFGAISESQEVNKCSVSVTDEDQFTHFENATSNHNNDDDLSVLVIGGKHIPSAQHLWVTDNSYVSFKQDLLCKTEIDKAMFEQTPNLLTEEKVNDRQTDEKSNSIKIKCDAFLVTDDDKYSVFHNPLPDEDEKQIPAKNIDLENTQLDTKFIFQNSLFKESDSSLDLFSNSFQTQNVDLPSLNPTLSSDIKQNDFEADDEYSNFQNFPVTFLENGSVASSESVDKYNVFRTIELENNSSQNDFQTIKTSQIEILPEIKLLESGVDEYKRGNQDNTFNDSLDSKSVDSIHFGDVQDSVRIPSDSLNINSLFSSLVVSERKTETENNSEHPVSMDPEGDRYEALRVLEPSSNEEVDDFGEFLGAELPNSGNGPRNSKDLTSIQICCLDACLQLLKDGVNKLSQCSTPEIMSEVLNDARADAYLDCLLEVYRVSQRIISQLNCDSCVSVIEELRQAWDSLAPYFRHSEHSHMVETEGTVCGVCRSNTGPSPVTFGAQSFHTPCANLYLHFVEPVLPNVTALVQ